MIELSKVFDIEPPTAQDIQQILEDLDENKDGQLTFEEMYPLLQMIITGLIEAAENQNNQAMKMEAQSERFKDEQQMDKELRTLFDAADQNKDGYIQPGELFAFLKFFTS